MYYTAEFTFLPRTGPVNLQTVGDKWKIYRRFYVHGVKMLRSGFKKKKKKTIGLSV